MICTHRLIGGGGHRASVKEIPDKAGDQTSEHRVCIQAGVSYSVPEEDEEITITRNKKFSMKPMYVEDARADGIAGT